MLASVITDRAGVAVAVAVAADVVVAVTLVGDTGDTDDLVGSMGVATGGDGDRGVVDVVDVVVVAAASSPMCARLSRGTYELVDRADELRPLPPAATNELRKLDDVEARRLDDDMRSGTVGSSPAPCAIRFL